MRKKLRPVLFALALCLGLMCALAGCGGEEGGGHAAPAEESASPTAAEPAKYTVTFQSGEETLEDVVVEVEEGEDAAPPDWELPLKELTG